MPLSDVSFALLVVGGILAVAGTLVGFPFASPWRPIGVVIAIIGMVITLIGIIIAEGAAFILILVIFLAVVALMYRHGLLPKL